jgi:hypothetical protein
MVLIEVDDAQFAMPAENIAKFARRCGCQPSAFEMVQPVTVPQVLALRPELSAELFDATQDMIEYARAEALASGRLEYLEFIEDEIAKLNADEMLWSQEDLGFLNGGEASFEL